MMAGVSPPPDVLVLAGGGVLGEAWMQGVLAGYEDASGHDFRTADAWVGTSAGSIVAATLASGQRPRRPGDRPAEPAQQGDARSAPARAPGAFGRLARLATTATAPLAPLALAAGTPAGARLRAAFLAGATGGGDRLDGLRARVDEAGARWDGRLRVVAVDRGSGQRVVFGAPGAPEATVGQAVQASCSIPWVFRAVRIGDREYVDGGAWSITNLDVAPVSRGQSILCLHPTLALEVGVRSPLGLMRVLGGAGTALETAALRGRGVDVRTVGPAAGPAELMARNLMDGRHAAEVLRRGYAQGRDLAA